MSQATLRTDRLELVPLSEDHLRFLVDLNSDPVVQRFLFHRGLTAEETEERLRRALSAAATRLRPASPAGSPPPLGRAAPR